MFGTCENKWVGKAFVLLLNNNYTKLYICPYFGKRLLQKQVDWQQPWRDTCTIFKEKFVVLRLSQWDHEIIWHEIPLFTFLCI